MPAPLERLGDDFLKRQALYLEFFTVTSKF